MVIILTAGKIVKELILSILNIPKVQILFYSLSVYFFSHTYNFTLIFKYYKERHGLLTWFQKKCEAFICKYSENILKGHGGKGSGHLHKVCLASFDSYCSKHSCLWSIVPFPSLGERSTESLTILI